MAWDRPMKEQDIQRAIFRHFKQRSAPNVFAFHPANGGYRRPVEAAILNGMGVVAGVPDIIAVKGGHTYGLELKSDDGVLSTAQNQSIANLRMAGATVAVAFGLKDAIKQLENWGLLKGVAT